MAERPIHNLPPMPKPEDFGYRPGGTNHAAESEYHEALRVWERVVQAMNT